ncbi:hypothetical protein ACTHAM_002489 [Cellulomonas soli]|uniref:hypothetical protein n=1 Tax=Cellulomonas soli TaxID=931535 RepID=UPI003F866FA6
MLHRAVHEDHDRRSARPASRTGRAVLRAVLTAAVLVPLSACTSSTPASLEPTAVVVQPSASPTETLLADGTDTHSAVGALVEGFPSTLVPVPEGAEVLVSAAAPVEGTDLVEISLNIRSAQDAAGLLDAIRGPLIAAGFAETAAATPDAGLAAQTTFSRSDGAELLVAGVLDRDGERTLTLGGQVRAGS